MKVRCPLISLRWARRFCTNLSLAFLAAALTLSPQCAHGQKPAVQKLTLSQIEQLVSHGVPDSTLSTQIQHRGIAFTPTPAILDSLRAKGAGPLTRSAIQVFSAKEPKPGQVRRSQGAAPTLREGVSGESTPEANLPEKVSISAGVSAGLLLQKTEPIYPPIAKAARVSGTVVLQATISAAGTVEDLHVVSGPALLQQAALDAVKDWRYRPYLLSNQPVEVETTVYVIFTLGAEATETPNAATKPVESGPSLAEIMQFIQDKMKEQGQVAFVATISSRNQPGVAIRENVRSTVDDVVADPASCTLHTNGTVDQSIETSSGGKSLTAGTLDQHLQGTAAFRDVGRTAVENMEGGMNRRFAESGHPEFTVTVAPPVFVVVLSSSTPVFSAHRSVTKGAGPPTVTDGPVNQLEFVFLNEETANQVAKAMGHAVELCGGSKQ
ncbi:MAG: energy transducer TonB [Terracidiphilus sp.]|jgi:TonB family protein